MAVDRGVTNRKLIVVLGATASGKSSLVNSLATQYNGEVVNADSRQVYTDLSIGTNKEDGKWKKRGNKEYYVVNGINYHLIDCISPEAYFSLYEYQKMAYEVIEDIYGRGKLPLLSGGTGMYIDAVADNWILTKDSYDKTLREELSKKSNIELLRRLEVIDPEAAKHIDVHNTARLIRAVEIIELTGKPKGTKPKTGTALFTILKIGIQKERDELYERIDERVEQMFNAGLVDEVKTLIKRFDKALPAFLSIGYKEIIAHLEGEYSLEEAKRLIKQNTRRYAKRQLTWWRRDTSIHWVQSESEATSVVKNFI